MKLSEAKKMLLFCKKNGISRIKFGDLAAVLTIEGAQTTIIDESKDIDLDLDSEKLPTDYEIQMWSCGPMPPMAKAKD